MGQIVYVDLLFLINFSMDFLCLFLAAKILSLPLSLGRALLGAAVGGIYADLALFFPFGRALSLLLDIAVCFALCAIVFYRKREGKSLPLYTLVFTAVSMTLGGIMTALFNLLNRSSLAEGMSGVEGDGISVWLFGLLALLSGGITLLGGRFFARRSSVKRAEIEVVYGGRRARLSGMTDTGNLLREPISGRPCIVADIGAMEGVLPAEILRVARKKDVQGWEGIHASHVKNLRLIPTKTASGEGILVGVRMEKITVNFGKGARQVDALLALTELGESAEGSRALIPTTLLVS